MAFGAGSGKQYQRQLAPIEKPKIRPKMVFSNLFPLEFFEKHISGQIATSYDNDERGSQ